MSHTSLFGCGTALVTPFMRDGSVDEKAFRALVEWQIAEGVHFLVPCGSTGEAQTLSIEEQCAVVGAAVEVAAGRVPVVAGAGSNDTRRAVELSREMAAVGATHLLHVTPMYNKPPQRGIVKHFQAIADAVALPIVAYNVPGRTGSNLEPETALALAEIPNVVAVKEASGNMAQIERILKDRPPDFVVLSGDDAITLALMERGGEGIISVVSNATPRAMVELVEAGRAGRFDDARAVHDRLAPWMQAAFVESNPIPVKAALAMLGRIENVLRLPLVSLAPEHEPTVREALEAAGAS